VGGGMPLGSSIRRARPAATDAALGGTKGVTKAPLHETHQQMPEVWFE